MTLAASGEMSIGGSTSTRSINLELGRSATATSSMGESALRTLAGVSSGAISMSNFYGKSNRTFPTIDSIVAESSFNASAVVTFATNGSTPPWTSPTTTGIGSDYEVRLVQNSGDTPTGPTLGSFHRIDSARAWTLYNDVYDSTKTCNVTATIRVYPGGSTVSTQTFDMTATVLP